MSDSDSYKQNKRLGIKVPRSILLPPYLSVNNYYVDYADAIDEVFADAVDSKIDAMANIRNMWVPNPDTEARAQEHELIERTAWSAPDRDLVVKQANMLGMKLRNAGVVSDDAYQTITRFVGLYWFSKGTETFIEFINYCLSTNLVLRNLWTEDYASFLAEGDPDIGTPIWEGGTWYPTTHVEIVALGGLESLSLETLQSFFYEIANYNLVLASVDSNFDMYMVDRLEDGHIDAEVVAIGLFTVNNVVMSTEGSFGVDKPDTQDLGEEMPTTYYAPDGVAADFSTAYLLAEPTGWMALPDGKKIPIYSEASRTVTDEGFLGTQLLGPTILSGEFDLMYGPVTWLTPPGGSVWTTSKIPAYSTETFTIRDELTVGSRVVGQSRNLLLTNPVGFVELEPGAFVPYW